MDNQGMNKMAKTTSSSSSMVEDDDRISKLPDPLIIHILSSLPTEQVVRTCILSKRWNHIWYSVPTLFFSNNITNISTHRTAKNEVVRKQGRDKFYSCVEKYLEHRKKGMNSIVDSVILTSFTLKMKGYYQTSKAEVLDKWLAFAVENKVKEMYLWIDRDEACDGEDMYDYVFYCLPKTIESARYLTDLELSGVDLDTSNFDFPSLKALSLVHVRSSCAVKNGEAFKFLLGCPSLEKLRLHKYYFKCISSFTEDEARLESLSLKFLELRDTSYGKLEVEAMNLESLVLIGVTEYKIDISACKKIRNLSFDDIGRNFNLYYMILFLVVLFLRI
uniref:F-box domain-containing protein n=1 Tax=Cannabis sativa TaxID=3483 RepID=A0A803Q066_CANSA